MNHKAYMIKGGVQGRERLKLLSEVMGPGTRDLLTEMDIPPGAVCLDVGCGGGDVTFELSRIVGPSGSVIGVDYDKIKLGLAKQEAERRGLTNISFIARDVCKWESKERFNVIYARFLLTHLRDPGSLIASMCHQLRPGGTIIVEDIDFRGHFSEPDCPALRKFVDLYVKAAHNRGTHPNIGPCLPGLLRQAGLRNTGIKLVQPIAMEGGIKLLSCVTLEYIAESVLHDELIKPEELDRVIEEFYAFARDPHTVIGGPRIFQAWARV